MKIAVVGGGIQGVMAAWACARAGHSVTLFERGELMNETSAASSKMLHGGIRYLEQGHFHLVREALQERAWWRAQAPHLTRAFPLLIPVYRGARRGRWLIGLGVALYDFLARGSGFPKGRWHGAAATLQKLPHLREVGLAGAWEFWDGQMDDHALGLWAAEQARAAGVDILTGTPVQLITPQGEVRLAQSVRSFDCVINATGPWASTLLAQSGIPSHHVLDLVRGTHLILNQRLTCGCVLQEPGSARVIFVLPWGEQTLLGTTEVLQATPDSTVPSEREIDELISAYNTHFRQPIGRGDVVRAFAGVRPVVRAGGDYSSASRESMMEVCGRVITILGGKWTTARAQAERVLEAVKRLP